MLSYRIQQFLRILPAKARIGNGFSVYVVSADLLASFYEVTLDHNAFDKFPDILINPAAVQDLFHNADLLLILLAGVGMIGVDENSRVFQIPLLVLFEEELDIFIMVVGNRISVFVYGPSEDRVGERIPFCPNFPASGDKIMSSLCRNDRVEHDS